MTILDLDFVRVFDCSVDKLQSSVGSIPLLLDDGDILSECLVGVLQLLLEALNFLILKVLGVWLLLGETSPQCFDLTSHLGLDTLDLLVLSLTPHFIQVS